MDLSTPKSAAKVRKMGKMGRPPVHAKPINVRLRPDEIAALDRWIEAQGGLPLSRPSAIRLLVRVGAGMERGKKR